jgi:hypothetical protein
MVPLLIMATSLVSKINTSVALLKGWVNSFLAFMGQVYIGFYKGDRNLVSLASFFILVFCWQVQKRCSLLLPLLELHLSRRKEISMSAFATASDPFLERMG